MKIKAIYKRIIFLFAAAFLSLFCLFESVFSIKAFADEQVKYDRTKIEYDLSDMNLLEYEFKSDVEVIRFQEYCYTSNGASSNYGLYLYVFNPTGTAFVKTDDNLVNMAVEYNDKGEPSAYENLKLTFLDETDDERFIKYKVSDSERLYDVARDYEESFEKRRYDVVGFEFTQTNGNNYVTKQEDIAISKTYYYTGYAASSDDETSTLQCKVQTLETIELEVNHTNYLMENYGVSDVDNHNICDNLHTVYFSVPERYFTDYGDLQTIAAEWYEYKTSPIFVTSDDEAYREMRGLQADSNNVKQDYRGVEHSKNEDGIPLTDDWNWRVFWEVEPKYIASSSGNAMDVEYYYNWRYNSASLDNLENGSIYYTDKDTQSLSRMSWLLHRDTDSTDRDEYWVSSSDLLSYAKTYDKNRDVPLVCGKYSYDLFSTFGNDSNNYELNSIDEDRLNFLVDKEAKNGLVRIEANAGETEDWLTKEDLSFWDKFWGKTPKKENNSIERFLTFNDLSLLASMDSESFSEQFYVNKQESEDIQANCKKYIEDGNRVVFFRFAMTDYYAANARFDWADKNFSDEDGFVSQQTVFLNFNIISLTFRNEAQEDTVIGIVSNPVDVFSSIQPPRDMYEDENWWEDLELVFGLILGGLGLAIFAPFLAPILGQVFNLLGSAIVWIFNALLTVIALPFKLIGKLFDKIFHKRE